MPKNGHFRAGRPTPMPAANIRPLLDRAGGLLSVGKGNEAVPLILQAISMASAHPEAAHMLGVAHLQSGKLAE